MEFHTLFTNEPLQPTHYTSYWKELVHVDRHGAVWIRSPVPRHKKSWWLVDELFDWPEDQRLIKADWLGLPLFF